eukprot:scaffold301_cov243-Pinguiococcus_pyrenoidosus.AAC.48
MPQHGIEDGRQRHPVRRILEARHVHHKHHVGSRVVAPNGAEMPSPGLLQLLAIVGADQHSFSLYIGRTRGAEDDFSELLDGGAFGVGHAGVRAVATRQTRELGQRDALLADHLQRLAAVQHRLVEEAPRALPRPARIHSHGVQHHDQRAEATVRRLVLRPKVLRQRKEALHVSRLRKTSNLVCV